MSTGGDPCQAPLVIHVDGYVTCLDDDCTTVHEVHVLTVDCDELEPHECGPAG